MVCGLASADAMVGLHASPGLSALSALAVEPLAPLRASMGSGSAASDDLAQLSLGALGCLWGIPHRMVKWPLPLQ